jgi:methylated-DNA-[protein]-cysteine S-methyltransferase
MHRGADLPLFYMSRPSKFGAFGVVWREAGAGIKVCRILLSEPAFPGIWRSTHREIAGLCERIASFLGGRDVEFDLGMLDLDICSSFQRRVLVAEFGIPRGWVSTYGRIGKHVGVEKGARAVGNALARNPFPLVIPCHRAVRSGGRLGGYQGGLDMKRALLEMEGVRIEGDKVIDSKIYY